MLTLKNVSLHRSGNRVLENLAFSLDSGERLGVTGENGAGKSSLLLLLASLLRPDKGLISWKGEDIRKFRTRFRPLCGYAPEFPALYDALNPEEHIRFCAGIHGFGRARTDQKLAELTELLFLAPFLRRPCGKLSKGQRQRTNLALSLVHEPELLLLDEPFSGLDELGIRQFIAFLRDGLPGVTVVMTAHSDERIKLCCSFQARLGAGRFDSFTSFGKQKRAAGE